jgi:hypothetical protein
MCDKPETSREHAPPRCLFPQAKDSLHGKNQRRNMIVVPSCDQHNGDKSADDTYLMQILPMSIGLNEVAAHYFQSKVARLVKCNKKLVKSLTDQAKQVTVHDTVADTWSQTIALSVDLGRVLGALEMNARAIYFHHRGVKFVDPVSVLTNFTLALDEVAQNDRVAAIFDEADALLAGAGCHGDNPDVFFYRINRIENAELLEMTFYGSSKVLVSFRHPPQPA